MNGFTATIPDFPEIQFWFHPLQRALLALLVHLAQSLELPEHRDFLRVAISSAIIRKWPNTLSQARDLDHSRPHRVLRAQLSASSQVGIFRRAFRGVVRALRASSTPYGPSRFPVIVVQGDSAQELQRLSAHSVDYVLTSPPYFNAIDYPRAHKFSQWWLWPQQAPLARGNYIGLRPGGKPADCIPSTEFPAVIQEAVSDLQRDAPANSRSLARYFRDLDEVIQGLARVLKPSGTVTLILASFHG